MRLILFSRSSSKHPNPSRPPASRHRKRKAILSTIATMMCLPTISGPQSPKTTMTRKMLSKIRLKNQLQLKHLQKSRKRKKRVRRTNRQKRKRAKSPLLQQQKRTKKVQPLQNRIHRNKRRKNNPKCLKLRLV